MSASSRPGARPSAIVPLITEHVHATSADSLLLMNCGFILPALGTGVLGNAGRVFATDRNIAAVRSAAEALGSREIPGRAIAGHGSYALPAGADATIVVIAIPREKAAVLQLLRDAFHELRVGGRCYIAGATNEGVKTAARLMHELFGNSDVLGRESSHRIVVSIKRTAEPSDAASFADPLLDAAVFREVPVRVRGISFTMYTRPGVFSWDHLDEATALLAEVMEVRTGDSVFDIGCGAGVLGVVASHLSAGAEGTGTAGHVTMVDADVEAVRCARRTADAAVAANVINASIEVLPSDVASAVIDRRFDVVLTNPPFHAGKATDLDVPKRFIRDAWTVLKPGGSLFLVANRTLPYERSIREQFGNITAVRDTTRFKVLKATRQ